MATKGLQITRNLSSLSAAITRPHRLTYMRTYPTVLVLPDGSTITTRYPEPRRIIKLPINIWALSEAERREKLADRKPKKKVTIEDDFEDSFDSNRYLKYLKNK